MIITSPHNEKLKEIRRLARRRGRADAGRFVAEGEDLLAAADAAGWPAIERFVAAGSGLTGTEVEPEILARVSGLGSGTRALALFEERWSEPLGPLCVCLLGRGRPGQRRRRASLGARRSARRASRSARAAPTRSARRPCARAWARCSRCRSPAWQGLAALPGRTLALVARGGEPLRGPAEGRADAARRCRARGPARAGPQCRLPTWRTSRSRASR